jgi:hypothetical protein
VQWSEVGWVGGESMSNYGAEWLRCWLGLNYDAYLSNRSTTLRSAGGSCGCCACPNC